MNVNELLVQTLSHHGPIEPDSYEGDAPKYLTFNFPDERGNLYGNNRPHCIVVYVQVHLYLDKGEPYQDEKLQICKELHAAGFSWPSVTAFLDPDTKEQKRHIVFETKIRTRFE